jgi:hypothetical protein
MRFEQIWERLVRGALDSARYRNVDLVYYASRAAEHTIIKEAGVSEDWVRGRSRWAMRLLFPEGVRELPYSNGVAACVNMLRDMMLATWRNRVKCDQREKSRNTRAFSLTAASAIHTDQTRL